MKAVGIHVFAGGFTYGVQQECEVVAQLERHGFGGATCEAMCEIPFINDKEGNWPDIEADFAYGNPRCTAFSTITAGYSDSVHGPWANACEDIHDLCNYAIGRYDCVIWESVQQAYSTGRPLLNYIRDEICAPKHYRVAHILLNAASMGNAQQRKRYFFVAYRDDRNFNIQPPAISPYTPVVADAIYDLRERETHESDLYSTNYDYDFDSYLQLTPDEKACVPHLPNGWDTNRLARYGTYLLPDKYKETWKWRTSDMPFSMHCPHRLNWLRPHPTIHSSAGRFIHPWLHRPLTVGELATVMGWPRIPVGPNPIGQIAKGVCPEVGTWLAQQVRLYLNNHWGNDDWESSYDHHKCEWVGRDTHGAIEKTFNLTRYTGGVVNHERYPKDVLRRHNFNVDSSTGELIHPWDFVRKQNDAHVTRDDRLERHIDEATRELFDEYPQEAQS
jgi:site-specific DNA-cytosine methylase